MRLPLLVTSVWLLGCAGTCSGALAVFDPPVGLTVERVAQTRDLAGEGVEGTTDERYVVVTVEVENTSANEEFDVEHGAFVLATTSGIERDADDLSALLPEACDGGDTLTFGAKLTCTLVFEVPMDDDPVDLVFRTPEGREGRAAVDLPSCDWCGDDCVDLATDPEHCGECDNQLAEDEDCVDGGPVCLEASDALCGESCVDLETDPDHCGACDAAVPPDHVCEDGEPECAERGLRSCADGCFDVDEDPLHCGDCDVSCPDERDWCMSGRYCRNYEQTSDETTTCDEVCAGVSAEAGAEYACTEAVAFYGSYCSGDYDDEASLACDEPAPEDNGYCTHFETLGCYCDHLL